MPRTIRYWVASAAAAGALGWAAWPGAPANPATLISRVDVIATVLILAGLPLIVRRKFGPGGSERLPRLLRTAGCAAAFALSRWPCRAQADASGRQTTTGMFTPP